MTDHVDLEELAEYLDSDLSPDDCMGLSDLDGYLTAIIVGPEFIMPSERLPMICGEEEPKFESIAHAEMIIGLIIGCRPLLVGVIAQFQWLIHISCLPKCCV